MKRFAVDGITREKEYDLTKGAKGSKVIYFSVNTGTEGEIVTVHLKPKPNLKKLVFDVSFNDLGIKGRASIGNILTKNPVSKILRKKDQTPMASVVPLVVVEPTALPELPKAEIILPEMKKPEGPKKTDNDDDEVQMTIEF